MEKRYLYFLMLLFVLLFIGCKKDGETGDENNPENPTESEIPEEFKDSYLNTTIQIDGANAADFYKGCYVNSIFDEVPVSDGSMKLQSNINKKVQTYFLTDGGDKIYQMTRVSDTEKNKKIDFSAESTAMAFVTFHPLFASIDSVAYDVLTEVILQSENFPKVRTEINNLIKQKKDLYNEGNIALFDALDSLLDEMIVFANFKQTEETASRAIKNERMYYPFQINSSGNRLDFQVYGLNPNYYGTATHANGSVEKLVVESHEDFGFLASLEHVNKSVNGENWKEDWKLAQYGKVESYTFPANGECNFHFSCKTKQNDADLVLRILSSICEMCGLRKDLLPVAVSGNISVLIQELNNSGFVLGMPHFPFYIDAANDMAQNLFCHFGQQVLDKGLEFIFDENIKVEEEKKFNANTQEVKDQHIKRIECLKEWKAAIKYGFKLYTGTKGIANIAVRLIAAQKASDPVDFKFCNYNNEVYNCSQLWKSKGDNQTGFYGCKLENPIEVAFNVDMGNHSAYMVKFEVCKGGGSVGNSGSKEEYIELGDFDNIASTVWTLGFDSQEQKVRVSLCDKQTKEAICEPVEFTAKIENPIFIVDGNNQKGKPNKTLPKKLQVGLKNPELFGVSEYKIMFEVIEGSGSVSPQYADLSGGIAECSWSLGNIEENQKVKAVLISSLTYKECSEPIYFEAYTTTKESGIIDFKTNAAIFQYDRVEFQTAVHASISSTKEIKQWGVYVYNYNGSGLYDYYPSMHAENDSEDLIDIYFHLSKDDFDSINYEEYIASEKIQIGIYEINDETGTYYHHDPEDHELIYQNKPNLSLENANVIGTNLYDIDDILFYITTFNISYKIEGAFWFDNMNIGIPSYISDEVGLIELRKEDGYYVNATYMLRYGVGDSSIKYLYLIGNLTDGGKFVSDKMVVFNGNPITSVTITNNTNKAKSKTGTSRTSDIKCWLQKLPKTK